MLISLMISTLVAMAPAPRLDATTTWIRGDAPAATRSLRRSGLQACRVRRGRTWRPPSASEIERGCDAGDGDRCARLGDFFRIGLGGVRRDRDRALRLYDKACKLRSGKGCASHATALRNPDDRNNWFPSLAVKLSQKACDYGRAQSCARVGWYFRTGRFVRQSAPDASRWFEKGCSLGHGPSCFGLARLLAKGGPGVKKHPRRALSLYHKACAASGDNGSGDACTVLGGISGRAVPGSPVTPFQVLRLLRKKCDDRSKRGCAGLGLAYLLGRAGLRKDAPKALELARKACDGHQAAGCFYSGIVHSGGLGVPRSQTEALKFLVRGCRMGNFGFDGWWASAKCCTRVGVHYSTGAGVDKNLHVAAKAYARACKRGDADACGQAGRLMALGRGGYSRDAVGGIRRAQTACSFGSGSSCFIVARAFRRGLPGVPKNMDRAEEYRRHACTLGYRPACRPFPAGAGARGGSRSR